MGDRDSYQALNQDANDAWGRHFFHYERLLGRGTSAGAFCPGLAADPLRAGPFSAGVSPLSVLRPDRWLRFQFHSRSVSSAGIFLQATLHPWLPYFKRSSPLAACQQL
jgi:hypothetical protein